MLTDNASLKMLQASKNKLILKYIANIKGCLKVLDAPSLCGGEVWGAKNS